MTYVRAKGWATSRLLFVALLIITLGAEMLLTETPMLGEATPMAITLLGIAVAWLRARTTQPLNTHPTKAGTAAVKPPPSDFD